MILGILICYLITYIVKITYVIIENFTVNEYHINGNPPILASAASTEINTKNILMPNNRVINILQSSYL